MTMKITGLITLLLSLADATDTNGIAFLRKAVEPTSRGKLDLIECLKASKSWNEYNIYIYIYITII